MVRQIINLTKDLINIVNMDAIKYRNYINSFNLLIKDNSNLRHEIMKTQKDAQIIHDCLYQLSNDLNKLSNNILLEENKKQLLEKNKKQSEEAKSKYVWRKFSKSGK